MHWDVGVSHYTSFNWGCGQVVDMVWFRSCGLYQFRSDQIVGQRDVVADLDRLVDVDDCKWARQTHLLQLCNGGFGGSSDGLFWL